MTGWGGPFKRLSLESGTAEHGWEARPEGRKRCTGSTVEEGEPHRPGFIVMGRNKKKKRDGDNRRPRLVLSFDEEKRR